MPLVGSSFREHVRAASPVAPPAESWHPPPATPRRGPMLALALALLVTLVTLEWYWQLQYSLGIFYVFPIMCAGTVLSRWQMLVAACFCALVRGQFAAVATPLDFWLRFAMASLAYGGIGLLTVEINDRRHRITESYERLRIEKAARYRAEDSLRLLAESSPAAILTLHASGNVLSANRAAVEMLGFEAPEQISGEVVQQQVPLLASVLRRAPASGPLRASTTSWARRANGQLFPVTVWFSTYGEGESRCLAGIIVDTSEEVRDREREAFRHFVDYNRLLAGAVSHEIRNLCSAIQVVTANLGRKPGLADDVDFRAIATLVDGLSRIASFDLRSAAVPAGGPIDLGQVLDQLRVVIEPDWTDLDGTVTWAIEDTTFHVVADAHALLQVFLNLTQNSLRACQDRPAPHLQVRARRDADKVVVSVIDDGPGVGDTSRLFHPFRPDADGTGLGLYVSRTVVQSYGGDLRHVAATPGCRFDVILPCEPEATAAV